MKYQNKNQIILIGYLMKCRFDWCQTHEMEYCGRSHSQMKLSSVVFVCSPPSKSTKPVLSSSASSLASDGECSVSLQVDEEKATSQSQSQSEVAGVQPASTSSPSPPPPSPFALRFSEQSWLACRNKAPERYVSMLGYAKYLKRVEKDYHQSLAILSKCYAYKSFMDLNVRKNLVPTFTSSLILSVIRRLLAELLGRPGDFRKWIEMELDRWIESKEIEMNKRLLFQSRWLVQMISKKNNNKNNKSNANRMAIMISNAMGGREAQTNTMRIKMTETIELFVDAVGNSLPPPIIKSYSGGKLAINQSITPTNKDEGDPAYHCMQYARMLRKYFADHTAAEKYYRMALAINPFTNSANGSFAYLLFQMGKERYGEGEVYALMAMRTDPRNPHGFYYYGLLRMAMAGTEMGNRDFQRMEAWKKCLEVERKHKECCVHLCWMISGEGFIENVITDIISNAITFAVSVSQVKEKKKNEENDSRSSNVVVDALVKPINEYLDEIRVRAVAKEKKETMNNGNAQTGEEEMMKRLVIQRMMISEFEKKRSERNGLLAAIAMSLRVMRSIEIGINVGMGEGEEEEEKENADDNDGSDNDTARQQQQQPIFTFVLQSLLPVYQKHCVGDCYHLFGECVENGQLLSEEERILKKCKNNSNINNNKSATNHLWPEHSTKEEYVGKCGMSMKQWSEEQ